ncbi:MAG TPA: response regulator, partial [Pedococcus sp.]|nr:response regulator [Pedococcus sp.]
AGVDLALAKPVLSGHLRDAVSAVLTGTVSRWSEAERATEAVEHGERDERGLGSAAVGGGSRPLGRVLLVEDHPVNQLVAEGILASLGYEVVVAGNGEQGVQRFAEVGDSLDAVLMDCQMPVLDGYAATRAIRAMEGPSRRLPIIALTAAAVTGERERCLEAGMDDFLTKPVDVGQLRGALQRWVSRAPGEPLVDTNAHPSTQLPLRAPTVDPDLLDADRLGELLDLDPGDPSMLLRFIGRFGASSRRTALEMAGRQSAGAAYEVGRLAHALKGSAANLGAHRLAARCYEVELLGEELVLASEDLIGSVAHEVEAATSALEAFAQGLRAAST